MSEQIDIPDGEPIVLQRSQRRRQSLFWLVPVGIAVPLGLLYYLNTHTVSATTLFWFKMAGALITGCGSIVAAGVKLLPDSHAARLSAPALAIAVVALLLTLAAQSVELNRASSTAAASAAAARDQAEKLSILVEAMGRQQQANANTLASLHRQLTRLDDAEASIFLLVPFDDLAFKDYRTDFEQRLDDLLQKYPNGSDRAGGLFVSVRGYESGKSVPQLVTIDPDSPAFPSRERFPAIWRYLTSLYPSVSFYRLPIDPHTFPPNASAGAGGPDLLLSLDSPRSRRLEYNVAEKTMWLVLERMTSDRKKWDYNDKVLSLDDLRGAMLFIQPEVLDRSPIHAEAVTADELVLKTRLAGLWLKLNQTLIRIEGSDTGIIALDSRLVAGREKTLAIYYRFRNEEDFLSGSHH